jgi:hypothetical protein
MSASEYYIAHALTVVWLPYAKTFHAVEALICLFIVLKLYEVEAGLKSRSLIFITTLHPPPLIWLTRKSGDTTLEEAISSTFAMFRESPERSAYIL